MTDGVNSDLTGLGAIPDPAHGYLNAFRLGQDLGRPTGGQPGNPTAGLVGGVTPDGVSAVAAQLQAMPPPLRSAALARAQQTNEALAHILMGLQAYPPQQRLGIAQHMAQQTGLIDPAAITAGDVSDEGIAAHLASAARLARALQMQPASVPSPPGQPVFAPAARRQDSAAQVASSSIMPDRHGNIILGVE